MSHYEVVGFSCPTCESKTEVYDSRRRLKSNEIWRRRRCLNISCAKRWTTYEALWIEPDIWLGACGMEVQS